MGSKTENEMIVKQGYYHFPGGKTIFPKKSIWLNTHLDALL